MTKTLNIAAAALAASVFASAAPMAAYASINPIEIDIAPEIAVPVAGTSVGTTLAQATYGATSVEEFEERLIRQSDDGTLNSQDILRIRMFENSLQSAQLTEQLSEEELIERYKSRSDDGTLNEHDLLRIRMQTAQATFGATSVEEFEDALKHRSDDGTLNAQDYFELRQFRNSINASINAAADAVTFGEGVEAGVEVAQWHPEAEALMERLERQSDDGTLNSQDYRQVRQLHQSLTS